MGITAATPSQTSIALVSTSVTSERPDLSLHASGEGVVTIMFSDIEDSTEINERLGDAAWLRLLATHNALLDAVIATHGGRTVKTIGDGYMVAFSEPAAGVSCALAIQDAITAEDWGDSTIRVRIGLHSGSVVRTADDFFGREVTLAARIASAAAGGEILVSRAIREASTAESQVSHSRERRLRLKGFQDQQTVYAVTRAG
jgi:class 3 adenylate cyclase